VITTEQNAEQQKQQAAALKKKQQVENVTFGKLEILRFAGFFVLFIMIVQGQLDIQQSFKLNDAVSNLLLGPIKTKKEYSLRRDEVLDWMENTLIPYYYPMDQYIIDSSYFQYDYLHNAASNLKMVLKRV
jgi:hypothetical protein